MVGKTVKKASLVMGVLAILGMGTVTVACSPRTEKPADSSVSNPEPIPTDKVNRTNVTRGPMSASPPVVGGPGYRNGGVPCGYGPQGGAGCGGR